MSFGAFAESVCIASFSHMPLHGVASFTKSIRAALGGLHFNHVTDDIIFEKITSYSVAFVYKGNKLTSLLSLSSLNCCWRNLPNISIAPVYFDKTKLLPLDCLPVSSFLTLYYEQAKMFTTELMFGLTIPRFMNTRLLLLRSPRSLADKL